MRKRGGQDEGDGLVGSEEWKEETKKIYFWSGSRSEGSFLSMHRLTEIASPQCRSYSSTRSTLTGLERHCQGLTKYKHDQLCQNQPNRELVEDVDPDQPSDGIKEQRPDSWR